MPSGILLIRWNERSGIETTAKYPEDVTLDEMTLMQVYSQHEYSQEAGIISLTVGTTNIVSYYSGPQKGYYVMLLLDSDDDPDDFESILVDISHIIIQNISGEKYKLLIPILFQKATLFSNLTEELSLMSG